MSCFDKLSANGVKLGTNGATLGTTSVKSAPTEG